MKVLRIAGIFAAFSLACAYFCPSDSLYAITIWPFFVWAVIGVALALPGIRRHRNWLQWTVIGVWLTFWVVLGEEKNWLPSRLMQPPSGAVEIVSLNCAGGSIEAAREAIASKPVLAFLQESPPRPELERLVREVYGVSGAVLVGVDTSIVVHGKVVPMNLNFGNSNFTVALVETDSLGSFLAVSLRLQPPVFRMDYWKPDCWRAYAEDRRRRRQELAEVAEYVQDLAPTKVILGGDFNSPPDRGTFAPLRGWIQSASDDSGYTAVNEFPMARIDQIWSRGFRPVLSRAEQTMHSDHRRVRVWINRQLRSD